MYVRLFLVGMLSVCGIAEAQSIQEFRLGVAEHNICVISEDIFDCDNANKEDGPNITAEVVFVSPEILASVFSPRPFLTASINTAGDTNYGGGGLMWNWNFAAAWSFEPSFGLVIHDGALDNPFDPGDARRREYEDKVLQLGSEVLFRTGLAVNHDLGQNWGVQLQYEHLSHGGILSNGSNHGLDNIGLRFYWRLN